MLGALTVSLATVLTPAQPQQCLVAPCPVMVQRVTPPPVVVIKPLPPPVCVQPAPVRQIDALRWGLFRRRLVPTRVLVPVCPAGGCQAEQSQGSPQP